MRKTGKATYTDWGKAPQTKTNCKLPRPLEFSGKLNSYLMLSFNNINYYSKLGLGPCNSRVSIGLAVMIQIWKA